MRPARGAATPRTVRRRWSSPSRRATTPSGCCARRARRCAPRPGQVEVWPAERLDPLRLDVPGDFSSAAPFLVAATLLPGSRLRHRGVGVNPTRTGLLHVLERMGARISLYNRDSCGRRAGRRHRGRARRAGRDRDRPGEVPALIDELPLFALAASMAHGESVVRGAGELRQKEIGPDRDGDRSPARPWRSGSRRATTASGCGVCPPAPRVGPWSRTATTGSRWSGRLRASSRGRACRIEGAEAVSVSFPGFFDLLESVAQR